MSRSLFDLRQAVRRLRRSPVFFAAATATLAIGIGAAAAIFAVVNGVMLRALPFGHSERLVAAWIGVTIPGGVDRVQQTQGTYFTLSQFAGTVDGIGLHLAQSVNLHDPAGAEPPRRMDAAQITASLLPVMQVRPLLGRGFTVEEDAPGGEPVVIIGEGLWRSQLGAAPDVLDRTVNVDGVSRRIVGVMPRSFRFPDATTALWLPLALDRAAPFTSGFRYNAVARLKDGVSTADAEREFTGLLSRSAELYPMLAPGVAVKDVLASIHASPLLIPLKDEVVGTVARSLWIIAATAGLLLLVACANVANLILVRADARQREIAVRTALGGGRRHIASYFFAEASVLALLAAAAGLAVAAAGIGALVKAAPAGIPRLAEVRVDLPVLAFTLVAAAVVALVAGGLPALRYRGAHLAAMLRDGGRTGTGGRSRQRTRGALVTAQVALAVVLLGGSTLLGRSFERLRAVRPGFDADRVATMWLSPAKARYATNADVARFYQQVLDQVRALPGVRAAGITSQVPLLPQGADDINPPYVENHPTAALTVPPLQLYKAADGGYFTALGIPLVAGRTFGRLDGQQRGNEVIVNREIARQYWNDSTGTTAIGKRLRVIPTGPAFTIVGVVGNTRDTALSAPPGGVVYFAEASDSGVGRVRRTMALVVRTEGDPAPIAAAVRQVVGALDPELPLYDTAPMADVVERSMAQLRFVMLMLGVASAVTLLLSGIGLYGVIACVVSLRTRELGVRVALGGQPSQVAAMVTRQGMALAASGLLAGIVAFVFAGRFLQSLLFEIRPADPPTLAAVSAVLAGVAALASWIPARRAARVDPMEALRAE